MKFSAIKISMLLIASVLPSLSSASESIDDMDIISSLNESNKDIQEFIDNKIISYQCVVESGNYIGDCDADSAAVSNMNEVSRFSVEVNKRNAMEKLVFLDVKEANAQEFVDYAEKTNKLCVKKVPCRHLDLMTKKVDMKNFDIMFVLYGGREVVTDTISVGYRASE